MFIFSYRCFYNYAAIATTIKLCKITQPNSPGRSYADNFFLKTIVILRDCVSDSEAQNKTRWTPSVDVVRAQ